MSDWCKFNGGPIDGDLFPIAAHCQTREVVIYQSGARPGYAGRMLDRPAVYVRTADDVGEHRWRGLDGVERTGATQGYQFDRTVSKQEANVIETQRWIDIDEDHAEGARL